MATKKRRRRAAARRDYREFVFRATGGTTDLPLSPICLYDNLVDELDRLYAIYRLLRTSRDELDEKAMAGVGELLRDVHDRMREVLRCSQDRSRYEISRL